jgi:hypothetical protein
VLILAVIIHHRFTLFLSFQSEMLAVWGIDALLADDIVARISATASNVVSASDSSALILWIQTMLDHIAPIAMSWSTAFAIATNSTTNITSSLFDLLHEIACLLPPEKLDLNDSDHSGILHALMRAQVLFRRPPERSLVSVFDTTTARFFKEMSRSLNIVVERCVQTDTFTETAAPSVKHSSSAVDVRNHSIS